MTEEDVKRLIEFRASNEALFTGKRNSAKIAWRYDPQPRSPSSAGEQETSLD